MYKLSDYNPFSRLRIEGVVGSVPHDFESVTVFSKGEEAIVVYAGLLAPPDCWDFGLKVSPSGPEKIPGEGSGYFRSRKDALLFALAEVRQIYLPESMQRRAVDQQINKLMAPSLF